MSEAALERARLAARASLQAQQALLDSDELLGAVVEAARAIADALRAGGRVWLFGNGGSAADSQHIAAELVGRFSRERPALAAEALTVNASILTAVANDYGFAEVFARQLEALAAAGDVAVGISTSGQSENVVRGLRTARSLGLRTVGLTGADAGPVGAEADLSVRVPGTETPRVQECHILVGHILCELVESSLADGAEPARGGR
jgi:D-sedoheptulose 7-phosphate isomerase